jgi:flavin reductase (DIM6/NTAB) family NADH-FMN oxidoreductase RutF
VPPRVGSYLWAARQPQKAARRQAQKGLQVLEPTPSTLREAFAAFPSGLVAVCALNGDKPIGMVASTFTGVSLAPPLVSVCVQHSSTTWPQLSAKRSLGLSVLSASHRNLARQIASKTGDRFTGVGYTTTGGGAVLLQGAGTWLDCTVYDSVPAGDHDIVLLCVNALQTHDEPPLVFHASRFHELARNSSQ